ncbi:MAG: sphingosine N-acyltransferase lag1 [Lichina confinis]|nr:MAG: sphingosine N-acyltransferase lag1 [Lichina confinis]
MSGEKNGQVGTTPVSQHPREEVDSEMNGDVRTELRRSRNGRCPKKPAQLGMRACIESHQITLAFVPLLALVILHFSYPELQHRTRKFFRLSYHDPILDKYAVGADDTFIVIHWIFLLTGLRAATMTYLLIPFARWAGVKKRKARVRFAEQAWLFLYDASMFSLGMYIFYHSDYWLNLREMWTTWPDRKLEGVMKRYYLIQFAFWLQQIVVVNIEERRKDYHQMLTHHIITCFLVLTSYGHHFTKVGHVILCLMEVVDVILPLAKMLKYMHFEVACDVAFGVFMGTWVVARHVLYMMVVYSTYRDTKETIPFGCFDKDNQVSEQPAQVTDSFLQVVQPFISPDSFICWTHNVKWTFLTMLLALQALTLIWFGMIMRVAWRIVKGGKAEDSRSEDEAEDDALELDVDLGDKRSHGAGPPTLDCEVGVDGVDVRAKTRPLPGARRYRKMTASATGVTLPGHHSDRKELLGRIGCDKSIGE